MRRVLVWIAGVFVIASCAPANFDNCSRAARTMCGGTPVEIQLIDGTLLTCTVSVSGQELHCPLDLVLPQVSP